jgi:DNA-binding response OmpR family regulator
MQPPARIWIIGADQWPRALLRAELIERGYEAVGFERVRDALIRLLAAPGEHPQALVIDLGSDGRPKTDDAPVSSLVRAGAPLVGITRAVASDDEASRGVPWKALLTRPISIGEIADAIERLDGSPRASE